MTTKRHLIELDEASAEAGYNAGLAGEPSEIPPDIKDGLAWIGSYIDGKAERMKPEAERRPFPRRTPRQPQP